MPVESSKEMQSFPTARQGPLGRAGLLKALFYFQIFLGEEGLCGIVQFCLEKDSRDDGPAERAGRACGVVFGQGPKAGLAEDVTARVAHVGVEVHIQAHGTDVAVLFLCGLILVFCTHLITQGHMIQQPHS